MLTSLKQWPQLPRFSRFLLARFAADGGLQSAAALTYMSLFAIVPLLTVVYSALSFVPALQGLEGEVEQWIYARFLPSFGGEISGYLSEFSRQARTLSGVGGLFLVVTAYFLLVNIEANFNRLWGCPGRRRSVSTFIHYWAILTLSPLLLGAALGLRTYLASLQLFNLNDALGGIAVELLAQLPLLLGWGALTLIYALVPNQSVSWRHAAIGGAFTALALALAKALFTAAMSQTVYAAVYGAFAAVPLFLIWIYLVWIIVLFGAELVWALDNFTANNTAQDEWPELATKLYLLWSGWQAGCTGAPRLRQNAPQGCPAGEWQRCRRWLLERGLVAQTEGGDYLLSCALGSVTMVDLFDSAASLATPQPAPWPQPLAAAQQLLIGNNRGLSSRSLEQLFIAAGAQGDSH